MAQIGISVGFIDPGDISSIFGGTAGDSFKLCIGPVWHSFRKVDRTDVENSARALTALEAHIRSLRVTLREHSEKVGLSNEDFDAIVEEERRAPLF